MRLEIYFQIQQMEPIKKEEKFGKERPRKKKNLQTPMDLMLLLPNLVDFNQKSKLKNTIKINAQSEELRKLSVNQLFQILCQIILYNIYKRDWSLKIRLIDQLLFSKFTNMFYILYRTIDTEKPSQIKIPEYEGINIQELLLPALVEQSQREKLFINQYEIRKEKNQLMKKYSGDLQYLYSQLFLQLNEKYHFSLNPITTLILIDKKLELDKNSKKPKELNDTYEIWNAFSILGFDKVNESSDPLCFQKIKNSNFQFKFYNPKKFQQKSESNEILKPYCFELILNKNLLKITIGSNKQIKSQGEMEKEEKQKTKEGKSEKKVENACPVYFNYLINYMQETYLNHPIRFSLKHEKLSNESFLKNQLMILKFMVPISYLGGDDERERQFINTKDWKIFRENLKKTILFGLCLENIMNELKVLEDDSDKQKKDKDDEIGMILRKIEAKRMSNLNAFWALYEQIKSF